MKPSAQPSSTREKCPQRDVLYTRHDGVVVGTWTPDMDDRLREGRERGLSYGQIATALRVTRNAAIGRGMRIGLATPAPMRRARSSVAGRDRQIRERRRSMVTPVRAPRIVAPRDWKPAPITGAETILTVAEGQCRYIGGPADFSPTRDTPVCGAPCDEGHAYCAEHHAVVFQ